MKVAILGKGVSGEAAAELAASLGDTSVFCCDAPGAALPADADLIVSSPGVKPLVSPLYKQALASGKPLISELEYGFRHFKGKTVAITGTNGKTTTTELTSFLLTRLGVVNKAAGNIGLPLSAVAAKEPETPVAVVEVSSFQLERVDTFAPSAAVLLNLETDHEDRYAGGFEEYCAVKKRIFDRVPEADRIWGLSFPGMLRRVTLEGDLVFVDGRPLLNVRTTALSAAHNRENLCAALELVLRIVPDKIFTMELIDALRGFRCGAHRIELFLEKDGIKFYDDSKGTNPSAVAAAMKSMSSPVVLVAGGLDKGMDFSMLKSIAPRLRAAVLIGECRAKLAALWQECGVPVSDCGTDFALAVRTAAGLAQKGDAVMLSPACASMDMFKSYAERGDQFQRLCREL